MRSASAREGDWLATTLGQLTVEQNLRVGSTGTAPVVLSSTKHYGLVPSDEYFKNRTIYSDDLTNYKRVLKDWFAYATNHLAEGSIGRQKRFADSCVSPIYTVFSCADGVHPPYLERVVKSVPVVEQYKTHEQATVDRRGAVRYRDFARVRVHLPPSIEQVKIAEILDTLDTAIRQTEAIIEKLKQVKQGLLHDLLTRGIDANGELRPPQSQAPHLYKESPLGWIPREWHLQEFSNLCESSAFGPRFPGDAYDADGPLATLRTTDMDDEGNIDLTTMPRAAIDPQHFAAHLLRPGDLVISRSGTCGVSGVFDGHTFDVVPGAFLIRFRLMDRRHAQFFRRYFNSVIGRPRLSRLAVGGVQKNIKGSDVLRLLVAVPPPDEAVACQRVIDVHEQVDRELRVEASKLRALKSGLMDDLLTGKVRVEALLQSTHDSSAV